MININQKLRRQGTSMLFDHLFMGLLFNKTSEFSTFFKQNNFFGGFGLKQSERPSS